VSGLPSLPVGRVRYHSSVSISSAGNSDAVRPGAAAGAAAAVADPDSESESSDCSSASR